MRLSPDKAKYLALALLLWSAAATAISPAERAALIALYNATDGDNWTDNTGWLGAEGTECTWHGVSCVGFGGRFGALSLYSNQLTGNIPPEIGQLSDLEILHLGDNQLEGPIPPEIGLLNRLIVLTLNQNQLTGTIPPEIGQLSELQYLHLDENLLTGEIPAELAQLNQLYDLRLGGNCLTATDTTLIAYLDLRAPGWQATQAIDCLWVTPGERAALIALYNATDGDNWTDNTGWLGAEGTECTWVGVDCSGTPSRVTGLELFFNQLTGNIPPELGQLNKLRWLTLNSNLLAGAIPPELGQLSQLQGLDLGGNQLTGAIPAVLGELSQLTELALHGNALTGAIPPELGQLSQLENLDLQWNDLSGEIPPEIGQLGQLTSLYLDDNELTGEIPVELAQLNLLQQLGLEGNCLTTTDTVVIDFLDALTPGWQATQDDDCGVGGGSHDIVVFIDFLDRGAASCTPNPVPTGGSTTCTASPNEAYQFVEWSGDCTGTTCVLHNVTGTRNVMANFSPVEFCERMGGINPACAYGSWRKLLGN